MIIRTKAKAFPHESARKYTFLVEDDKNFHLVEDAHVLVWDSVAVHFTRCHCLSSDAIDRIREMAKAKLIAEYKRRTQTIEPGNHGDWPTYERSLTDPGVVC